MDIEIYENPDRPGVVRIVNNNGAARIVEINSRGGAINEVDGVPDNWVKYVRLPQREIEVFLSGAVDALDARNASAEPAPLAVVDGGLAFMLGEAVELINRITGNKP